MIIKALFSVYCLSRYDSPANYRKTENIHSALQLQIDTKSTNGQMQLIKI